MARAQTTSKSRRRTSRLTYLRAALEQLDQFALDSAAAKSYTAAVAAKAKAVLVREQIDELEQAQAARRRRRRTTTTEDYYDELLETVRQIRVGAMASGSHVAAVSALKLESDILHARDLALDRAAASARAAMSIEDIEAEIARLRAQRGA